MPASSTEGEKNPLSLLSYAAVSQPGSAPTLRAVPRSAPTTSVSQAPQPPPPTQPANQFAPVQVPVPNAHLGSTSPPFASRLPAPAGIVRGSAAGSQPKPRRLSSASQTKRRLSEATNAAIQASATGDVSRGATTAFMSNSAGLTAATAALSLSGSPPNAATTTHLPSVHQVMDAGSSASAPILVDGDDDDEPLPASGKKKGTIYKCETCPKVYRHPNCLLKHRWEHSPHWREASKFLLSKHQQVQLLEAAAILSHISPPNEEGVACGTSLPDDRALWPSYLSNGALPMPSTKTPNMNRSASSNLSTSKGIAAGSSKPSTSMQQPQETRGESSSSDDEIVELPHQRGTSASMPASSSNLYSRIPPKTFATARGPSLDTTVKFNGAFSAGGVPATFGGTDAINMRSPTSPGGPFGFQSRTFEPPHSSTMMGRHRHTRTSSSVSSSFTRSSVRGGLVEEDEDEDDYDFDDVGGYLDKSFGSLGTNSTSFSVAGGGALKDHHRQDALAEDVGGEAAEGWATASERGGAGGNSENGAGMDVDNMDL